MTTTEPLTQNNRVLIFVLFVWATLVLYSFFPGYMSVDSFSQLNMARSGGEINNWHSAFMTWVWRLADQVIAGPFVMFFIQVTLFSFGTWLVLSTLNLTWFWCLPLLLAPHVFGNLSTVWKDVWLGVFLFVAVGLLLRALKTKKTVWSLSLFVFLSMAVLLRHNAASATLPFFIVFALAQFSRKKVFCGIGFWVLSLVTAKGFEKIVLNPPDTYPLSQIMLFDLTAVSIHISKDLLPSFVKQDPNMDLEDLKKIYNPRGANFLVCCLADPNAQYIRFAGNPRELLEIKNQWKLMIQSHPKEYFVHKWAVFKEQLSWPKSKPVCYPFHQGIEINDLGFEVHRSSLNYGVMSLLYKVQNTFLFRTWFYLLLGVVLAVFVLIRRTTPAVHVLVWSSWAYAAPYLFVSVACDFRYTWWSALAFSLALILILSQKFTR